MDEAFMGIGVYIHIPFCKSRCKYCDFYSTTLLPLRHQYAQAVIEEWKTRVTEALDMRTVYFGGGTPSQLADEDIELILDAIKHSALSTIEEITLEANPGDLTVDRLKALKSIGINRLSIGIQSFDDNMLQRLGRRHTAQHARQVVKDAQDAGFDNISIDLMYGLPEQTLDNWQQQIDEALKLKVQHISAYCLSYEENTPFGKMLSTGEITEIDEDTENEMADILSAKLKANGYIHYEISNFALPSKESKHNSSYWNAVPYIGLGAGAHSFDGQSRSWNIDDVKAYIQNALAHSLQPESEMLTNEEKHTEKIMLGLRTNIGVPKNEVDTKIADDYINRGILKEINGNIVATQQGLHILNRIIEDLI